MVDRREEREMRFVAAVAKVLREVDPPLVDSMAQADMLTFPALATAIVRRWYGQRAHESHPASRWQLELGPGLSVLRGRSTFDDVSIAVMTDRSLIRAVGVVDIDVFIRPDGKRGKAYSLAVGVEFPRDPAEKNLRVSRCFLGSGWRPEFAQFAVPLIKYFDAIPAVERAIRRLYEDVPAADQLDERGVDYQARRVITTLEAAREGKASEDALFEWPDMMEQAPAPKPDDPPL